MMMLRRYCICGAAWKVDASAANIESLKMIWKMVHHGPGHRSCDARTASKARRRDETQMLKGRK